MYRGIKARLLRVAAGVCVMFALAPAIALAHDGPPRLDLNSDRLVPGATLEVRGINVAPDLPVWVTLYGDEIEIPIGETVGDEHGDFALIFALPADLPNGDYVVQASSPSLVTVGASLTIEGVAIVEGEGEGQRDEDEPLLGPLPQGRILSPVQTGPTASTPALPSASDPALPAIALGGLAVALLGFALAVRRRRTSHRSRGISE